MSRITIRGFYRDQLLNEDGQIIFDSTWRSNMIVMRCRILLAGFMKNEPSLGIRSLQVGKGDPAWDNAPPPAPNPDTTEQLTDVAPFIIPQTDLTLQYLNESDQIVVNPTNRIQIIATLGPGKPTLATDPPYPLREFGLFGELNGTPCMINYIRHPLIEKDGSVTLERRVRLIF